MKKNLLRIGIAMLALSLLIGGMTGCASSDPPALEEIYDVAVELIEKSFPLNSLMFGEGLPVWKIGSDAATAQNMYSGNTASYEYVTEKTPYTSVQMIKDALEEVYSKDYLESLYPMLFEGYVDTAIYAAAQIHEDDNWLYQNAHYEPLLSAQRIYDYSTMEIALPSSRTYVTIAIDTHLPEEEETLKVKLGLIYEDEHWHLDSPTY